MSNSYTVRYGQKLLKPRLRIWQGFCEYLCAYFNYSKAMVIWVFSMSTLTVSVSEPVRFQMKTY